MPKKDHVVCDQFVAYDLYIMVLDGSDFPSNKQWLMCGNEVLVRLYINTPLT
jgi:hypothetical protein